MPERHNTIFDVDEMNYYMMVAVIRYLQIGDAPMMSGMQATWWFTVAGDAP